MADTNIYLEWLQFAKSDLDTAAHLYHTMHPMPLEIICYHCQQAAEKALKGFLISKDVELQRTHDLGLLAELCQTASEFPEEFLESCDELTPYGVKIRYPQELDIAERHASRALEQATAIYGWAETQLRH